MPVDQTFTAKAVGERVLNIDNDNTSEDSTYVRVGLKGKTKIDKKLTGYGQWEYNMNVYKGKISESDTTRLGFVGISSDIYGSFDYGRNYGAIHDVEVATDKMIKWGGDSWSRDDNFVTGLSTGVATYRNSNFFGLVNGLDFAIQYQGKNETKHRNFIKQNGDGFSSSVSYKLGKNIGISAGYAKLNRTDDQQAHQYRSGSTAEAWATSAKYDSKGLYAAIMYSQTHNMTPEPTKKDAALDYVADKTRNLEAVIQYQFKSGLRPSVGYVQSKGEDLKIRPGFGGGKTTLMKYMEVGTSYKVNDNMNVYAAYKFNFMKKDEYSENAHLSMDDQTAAGIVYKF